MKKTPLRKVSTKRAAQLRIYARLRKSYLKANPICKCGLVATEIHHRNGRYGRWLTATESFMAVCRICHSQIHANPKIARKNGWLK